MQTCGHRNLTMHNRREFLKASSLLSLAPVLPAFLSRTAMATEAKRDERILVVMQLSGGNDGLNTVIPFADENYGKYRTQLKIDSKDVIKISDTIGLHPDMNAAAGLLNDGRLGIINGVGYPSPNRSHFESMAIWHSARLDREDHNGQGWLGRAADISRDRTSSSPDAVFVGDGAIPSAIVGRRAIPVTLSDERELMLASGLSTRPELIPRNDLSSHIEEAVQASFAAAKQFSKSTAVTAATSGTYPRSALAEKMKLLAKIIRMEGGTRIFYVQQPGYDTHSGQKFIHARLLREFSTSLNAFLDDMKNCGLGERVTVLAFSEFGRRVKENASAGTDHGTSGPVFVAGESVNSGMIGEYPSLANLEDGDLKTTTDFRCVYRSLLTDWLGIDSAVPLGGDFDSLNLVKP